MTDGDSDFRPPKSLISNSSNSESDTMSSSTTETELPVQKKKRKVKRVKPTLAEKHKLLSPCECKLKKCVNKLGIEQRTEIHRAFWSMSSHDRRVWLFGHVDTAPTERRYRNEGPRRKLTARRYWLPAVIRPVRVYVCKTMFLRTLGYTHDRIVSSCLSSASPLGVVVPSKRGKHPPKHKLSEHQKDTLMKHINMYEPQISHYRREHAPNRLYLPSELTMKDMYDDYVERCTAGDGSESVSYVTYTRQISSMNISFARLGNEECEICDQHKIHLQNTERARNDDGDNQVALCGDAECVECETWLSHKRKYRITRAAYKHDKESVDANGDTVYLSSDMQKVILLPRLPGYKLCMFTKRLVVINQTFAPINKEEVHKKKALGVLWHEGVSGRKDEDVTSAFIKCMEHPTFRDYSNFVIWVDNCSGQNKNWTLYTSLIHIVNNEDGPNSVTLKYFTTGHTFMSADNFHSKVEQKMKNMHEVCDWGDFVACVRNAGEAYEMKVEDFKLYESGLSQGKTSKESRPLLSSVSVAQFRKGEKTLFYKKDHNEEFSQSDFLRKKVSDSIMNLDYQIKTQTQARGVTKSKLDNIVARLGPLMKPSRINFYKNLRHVEGLNDMMDTR